MILRDSGDIFSVIVLEGDYFDEIDVEVILEEGVFYD